MADTNKTALNILHIIAQLTVQSTTYQNEQRIADYNDTKI